MEKSKLGVALTKCFYCCENSGILMNRILTTQHAKRVEEAHGQVIDMIPCSKCEEYMEAGVILITMDGSRSDKNWRTERIPNPYRTGGWFVIRESGIKRMPIPDGIKEFLIDQRWGFIEHEAAEKLGLIGELHE